jgi:formylmethanofuran dehydrogenase subunit B
MEHAWIAGEPATLEAAIVAAAKLLAASRSPVIAGLGTDVAGARAAVSLAEKVGAVVDHMHADALLCNLDVMRSSGVLVTTPTEAQVRADTLLLVGPGLDAARPQLPQRLFAARRQNPRATNVERRMFCLCPGRDLAIPSADKMDVVTIGKQPEELPALLAALRARVAGRPVGQTRVSLRRLDEIATRLKEARYGVAIWSAAVLDALTIEMVCGLVDDLNGTTRFAGLPLAPGDNAVGVMQTCAWLTAMPMRSALGRGSPRHDPWLFESQRLVASGETDCVLWISAYRAVAPAWRKMPPTIALTDSNANFLKPPRVHIAVGCPGVDHNGVEYRPSIGTLGLVEAREPNGALSAADVIAHIAASLPDAGGEGC